jgi:hypothetical protein
MQLEDAVEHLIASAIQVLRRFGIEIQLLDLPALAALCHPIGVIEIEGVPVVMVKPIGAWGQANAAVFDRKVVAAGLTRFARPAMAEDGMPPGAVVEVGQGRTGS